MNSHQERKVNRIMLRADQRGGISRKEQKFLATMFPGFGTELQVVKQSDVRDVQQ